MADDRLSRAEASAAVEGIGWRYLLGTIATSVDVPHLADGVQVAEVAVRACAGDADEHLRIDARPRVVQLRLQTRSLHRVTTRDTALAGQITEAVRAAGLDTAAVLEGPGQALSLLEIAVDTVEAGRIRPFWQAVLGYDDHSPDDEWGDLVDPVGTGPSVWFQKMDPPRTQRNRLHLDLTVPHDAAERRVAAAVAAGGRVLDDTHARAFWVLADADGNEVCICTWQDREH